MGHDYDETAKGTTTNKSTTWREDEDQREDAATPQDEDESESDDQGQVSEGGSSSVNSEANRGGADSVPDTPDDNPPFERPGSSFTDQSKGGGDESTRG